MNKPKTEYTATIMDLFYNQGKTLPEIAKIMGRSYNTIFQQHKRKSKEYLKNLNAKKVKTK